ncbi:MAG: hypothetical protein JSU92_00270 [Deltaproteobacteria bacterium]|nr:MAG: hypothetical protein JSU92_00270 [Deltaproteobacteria bacterium]
MERGIYEKYRGVNLRLRQGKMAFLLPEKGRFIFSGKQREGQTKLLHYPALGVYAGKGSSHSWLWFVTVLERMGFYNLRFLNEEDFKLPGSLNSLDSLIVSGGELSGIAEGLGREGAKNLKSYIKRGGTYLGSCAGACLPLHSSKPPLSLFNLVKVKINNISTSPPPPLRMEWKYITPYGADYIFHPVRDEVVITASGLPPFYQYNSLVAPLYGGPPMRPPEEEEALGLAQYRDFTPKTLYLTDARNGRKVVLGTTAAIRKDLGRGSLFLFGPHFEHPDYPQANAIIANTIFWGMKEREAPIRQLEQEVEEEADRKTPELILTEIKREVSNSRVYCMGMLSRPLRWQIRDKVYEPEQFLPFLDAVWKRIKPLQRLIYHQRGAGRIHLTELERVLAAVHAARDALKRLNIRVRGGGESTGMAEAALTELRNMTRLFLSLYYCILDDGVDNK